MAGAGSDSDEDVVDTDMIDVSSGTEKSGKYKLTFLTIYPMCYSV